MLTLTTLIDGLFETVCARYGVFPIRGPLVRFLWKRFFRVKQRFAALAARFAAGQDLSPRPSRKRAARAPQRPAAADPFPLTRWVNPTFGWLCRVASGSIGARAFAFALRELLTNDPDMLALLAASPATARALRPLCWMLGVAQPPTRAALAPPLRAAGPDATRPDEASAPRVIAVIAPTVSPRMPADPLGEFSPVPVLRAA